MSQKFVKVKLTPKDIDKCGRAGKHRFFSSRGAGIEHNLQCKKTKKNDPVRDVQGIKAELAVAKLFDVELNLFECGPDNGIDLWIDDISVDVKVTTYVDDPHLVFMSGKTLRADIGILTVIAEGEQADEVTIGRWITKTLWEKHKEPFFHSPKDDAVPFDKLLPMYELWIARMNRRFKG